MWEKEQRPSANMGESLYTSNAGGVDEEPIILGRNNARHVDMEHPQL